MAEFRNAVERFLSDDPVSSESNAESPKAFPEVTRETYVFGRGLCISGWMVVEDEGSPRLIIQDGLKKQGPVDVDLIFISHLMNNEGT